MAAQKPPVQPCEEPSLPALGLLVQPLAQRLLAGAAAPCCSLGWLPGRCSFWGFVSSPGTQCSTQRLVVAPWCFSLHLKAPSLLGSAGGAVAQSSLPWLCLLQSKAIPRGCQQLCNCVTEFTVYFRPGKPCLKRDKIDTLSPVGHVHY